VFDCQRTKRNHQTWHEGVVFFMMAKLALLTKLWLPA